MSGQPGSEAGDPQSFYPCPFHHIHQPLSLKKKKEKKGTKKSAFQIHKKAVLFQQQRKHVNVNKTFILFVNRLLNKVNITKMEGGKHPSKCPQRPLCLQCQNMGIKRENAVGIYRFCSPDAKHMDRMMDVQCWLSGKPSQRLSV